MRARFQLRRGPRPVGGGSRPLGRRLRAAALGAGLAGTGAGAEAGTAGAAGEEASPPRLVVLAVDGAGRVLVERLLAAGELPNFARLRREGAFSDGLVPAVPSLTAPSFAALWNGLPGAETGITGNTVLATPPESHSLLDTADGFSAARLRTRPLWARVAAAGRRAVAVHTTHTFPLADALAGLDAAARWRLFLLTGYTDRRIPPATLDEERNPLLAGRPPGGCGFGEGAGFFRFEVGETRFLGAFFDDPADPRVGWDTFAVLSGEDREGEGQGEGGGGPRGSCGGPGSSDRPPLLLARVRVGERGSFSIPIAAEVAVDPAPGSSAGTGRGRADFRVRAFAARPAGPASLSGSLPGSPPGTPPGSPPGSSARFLVFRSAARGVAAWPEPFWRERLGEPDYAGSIGAAEFAAGRLGRWPRAGDAVASAAAGAPGLAGQRLLEVVEDLEETARAHLEAAADLPDWNLLALYLPFADEVGHLVYGALDERLPSHDPATAAALRPVLAGTFAAVDRVLGDAFRIAAAAGAHLLVVGDHGMAGTDRRAHLNVALERAGLLAFGPDGRPDLSRTRVLLLTTADGSLAVNRVSRPGGVVEPGAAEERALREAREALLALRTPEGEPLVFGFLDPGAPGLLRFGGDSTGDLFPILRPGYRSSPLPAPEVVTPAPPAGSHGFLPTRRDMQAVFAAWGPRIAPGRWPRASALAVLPTALDLLGLPPDPALPGRSLLGDAPLVRPGADREPAR